MLASPAALMGVMNVRTGSWRLGHACGASMPQGAQPFSLSSCGFETNRCVAGSSILDAAQVVLLPPIRMFELLPCYTCGHNNPNSFRVGSRGCEHTVSVPCGYAVYRDDGAPTWYYCHQCYGPERQSIVSPGSTAQSSGPTIPELFPTGSKAETPEPRVAHDMEDDNTFSYDQEARIIAIVDRIATVDRFAPVDRTAGNAVGPTTPAHELDRVMVARALLRQVCRLAGWLAAQVAGQVEAAILKEGRKLAVELKLRKSPLKTPEVPMGGHKGDSEGHGAEDA